MPTKKVSTIPPPEDLVSATVDAHRATRGPSTETQHVRIVVKIRNGGGGDYAGKGYVDLEISHGMEAQAIADEIARLVTSVGLHNKAAHSPE